MRIKKFLIIIIIVSIISFLGILFLMRLSFQNTINVKENVYVDNDVFNVAKTNNGNIEIFRYNKYHNFKIKGIRLASFYPNYERYKSNISTELVKSWLRKVRKLNANTIIVPYIQPPNFYKAIYEFNTTHENPIYIMHEVSIDTENMVLYYNAFEPKLYDAFLRKIKNTIDVTHGMSFIMNNDGQHNGLYIRDISKYNLGYLIGGNTSPEFVSITNMENKDQTNYTGKYYKVSNASAFEVFITKIFDEIQDYEQTKYKQKSLLSYVGTAEIDPFVHNKEPNVSKHASIYFDRIEATNKAGNTIFVSLVAHPNDPDFLDIESVSSTGENSYANYLKNYTDYYQLPVIISELGVSSSRGKSKVNVSNGYDRGNFNEKKQGEVLIELLDIAKKSNISGVVVDSFQDDWGRVSTPILKEILDTDNSIYWYDAQSSDEGFGLMAFDGGEKETVCYIDGLIGEWKKTKPVIKDKMVELKAKVDPSYLYLLINKKDWKILEQKVYVGIDILPNIGSGFYAKKNIKFNVDADFILQIESIKETTILANERYNIFNYNYRYHNTLLDKIGQVPSAKSKEFSSIFMLNRKHLYDKETGKLFNNIYYNTGLLVEGNGNPKAKNYNSLADFNKTDDVFEVRIPWTLINVKNPLSKVVHGDFYRNGILSESKISNIEFSITSVDILTKTTTVGKKGTYHLPNLKDYKYHERLKESFYVLRDYWK